jgi:hypothetical protein
MLYRNLIAWHCNVGCSRSPSASLVHRQVSFIIHPHQCQIHIMTNTSRHAVGKRLVLRPDAYGTYGKESMPSVPRQMVTSAGFVFQVITIPGGHCILSLKNCCFFQQLKSTSISALKLNN